MQPENYLIDTLMGEIPILEELKPQAVSIYQENAEGDDWYNQTKTIDLSNITTYEDILYHSPGYFLVKTLTASFYFGRGAPYTYDFTIGVENGDVLVSWSGVSGVIGSTLTYDLTSIFLNAKLVPGTRIYVYAKQNLADAGTNPSYATLTMSGFKIRPFDIYKPAN